MGIGRREFLTIFGTILAKLALASSSAAGRHDDLYLNRRLGIAFRCPEGWDFCQLESMGEIQNGQLLDVDSEESNAAILKALDLPFVAISPKNSSNICVQIYLASHPDQLDLAHELMKIAFSRPNAVSLELQFTKALRIIRRDLQISRGILKAFKITDLPSQSNLSGCPSAEYTSEYDFEHERMTSYRRVRVRTIAIEHHQRFYLVRLISDASLPFDFNSFVEGIKLM